MNCLGIILFGAEGGGVKLSLWHDDLAVWGTATGTIHTNTHTDALYMCVRLSVRCCNFKKVKMKTIDQ